MAGAEIKMQAANTLCSLLSRAQRWRAPKANQATVVQKLIQYLARGLDKGPATGTGFTKSVRAKFPKSPWPFGS